MRRIESLATGFLAVALAMSGSAQATESLLRFKVNPAETKITASVAEPMAMIRGSAIGKFEILSGDVEGDPTRIDGTGRVKVVIDAASYQTDSESRDQDVKENALETQKFPTITFESKGLSDVQKENGSSGSLRLLGQLTLHGVSKEIELPVALQLDSQGRLVADGNYTFKFEDYGVKRPSKMMGLMTTGDEAKIDFHVVADPA